MDVEHALTFTLAPLVSLQHHEHNLCHWFALCYFFATGRQHMVKSWLVSRVVQMGVFHVFRVFPGIENVASLNLNSDL